MTAGTVTTKTETTTASARLDHLVCPICLSSALTETPRHSARSSDILGETEIVCSACNEHMSIVLNVPYLSRFMHADMLSVLEVTSYLHDFVMDQTGVIKGTQGSKPALLGASYAKIQTMLDMAEDRDGAGIDFKSFGYEQKPAWFANRYEELVQFRQVVAGLDFEGKHVLDIGAGTGFDSLRFHRAGAKVTALEYNPLQAAIGQLNFPEFRWIGNSVTHMPFADEHFDIVIANCALHHVLHLENGISEMLRVLKVGGHMLTIGDSFGPNTFTIEDEVRVFNNHPAVLRGVNEQVPRFERFLSPLLAQGAALDIELMTAVVHGLHKNVGTLRRWGLEEGLATLRNYRGGLCMRVLKQAPTTNDQKPRAASPPLVPVGEFVSNFASREQALRYLARAMPLDAVNLPILDQGEQKLRLLLGWRRPEDNGSNREGVGNAYLFATPAYIADQLRSFEILVPRQAGKAPAAGLRFELSFDGMPLAQIEIDPGSHIQIETDLPALTPFAPDQVGLLSFHVRDNEGRPTSIAFRVGPTRIDSGGLAHHLKAAISGPLARIFRRSS